MKISPLIQAQHVYTYMYMYMYMYNCHVYMHGARSSCTTCNIHVHVYKIISGAYCMYKCVCACLYEITIKQISSRTSFRQ
jgi:hypothetical protein